MLYHSLHHQSPPVDFREATIAGQAPDKGLYFPEQLPVHSPAEIETWRGLNKIELGLRLLKPYLGNAMDEKTLSGIIEETLAQPFHLVQITEQIYALELFHGPTLAFKDVGARFMSRCLGYFSRNNDELVTVLVATSGDTGSAVAHGFEGVEGVEVIILYPSGKVSPIQELQLTTCGGNITALEVAGSFDDCQAMVKEAFMDPLLKAAYQLTSANSINVARWLPQQLYYALVWQQWPFDGTIPMVAVPSGNMGNIAAGLLAKHSGLPIDQFIAACNENDTISAYLHTGMHTPRHPVPTLSNAMDVGNPSNLVRIAQMFNQRVEDMALQLQGITITDQDTLATMRNVYQNCGYLLDPHGAVAYAALERSLPPGKPGVFLATAHPVKFPDVVEQATGIRPKLPSHMEHLLERTKQAMHMEASYPAFREWMLSRKKDH